MKQTILVIDDEPHLVLGLRDALEFEGYRVVTAGRGKEGVQLSQSEHPDAVLLDLMLPDMNGYQVCEEIRRHRPLLPILMLTARSQESDKVRGLNAGADDYVTKPFSINELVARIRAICRRVARSTTAPERMTIGDVVVNLRTHLLETKGGPVELSFYEVELLKLLAERSGEPVSRDEILEKVWGLEPISTNRTVDNFIVKLRKKIEESPDKPKHILTVYGLGYKLVR